MGHQNQMRFTILKTRHRIIDPRCILLRDESVQRFRVGAGTAFEDAFCSLGRAAPGAEQYPAGHGQAASLELCNKPASALFYLDFTASSQRAIAIR